MSEVTAIITAYRRPDNIPLLARAVRKQSVPAAVIWAWANEPNARMKSVLAETKLDRVVTSTENAFFHGRFALALLARTEFVAVFDDDSIPGENWLANCLETMSRTPGILGTAGVVLHDRGYANRTMHGWQRPSAETVEVDLVGQAWFLRTEWVKHLFSGPPVTGTNGEDIELAARAWRLVGIRSFCPPHPPDDRSRWGSLRGLELGMDDVASSLRVEHLAERRRIVEAELEAGWRPLFMRQQDLLQKHGKQLRPADGSIKLNKSRLELMRRTPCDTSTPVRVEAAALPADVAGDDHSQNGERPHSPRWTAQCTEALDGDKPLAQPDTVTLRLDGLGEAPSNRLDWLDIVESPGAHTFAIDGTDPPYDRIECGAAMELVRDPLAFLRRLRALLKAGGRLSAAVANVRQESFVSALIDGRWIADQSAGNSVSNRAGCPQASPVRFFTRRELEKIFCRAGFEIVGMSSSPGEAHERADRRFAASAGTPTDESRVTRYSIEAAVVDQAHHSMTSIVIVTHNQLECTRACLASIRFLTDEPYELVLVDNGSTDGTVDYLRSCPDVRLIENHENRGFPAAANQGIRASRGEQVLLLNNDVLVTSGWLARLLRPLGNDKAIGLVGPLSNFASGSQDIKVGYTNLACLDGFAWEHAERHARQIQEVERLIGFCLLLRREVIDQVGLLDERFGIGNYEDDDYCRRARDAGWRLVVAQDAFIHHFGHRTFDGAGVDLRALLHRNRKLFEEKWGEPSATTEIQSPQDAALHRRLSKSHLRPRSGSSCSLSLCMIVRDNEGTIRACLESIKPWVDEMIVVDTGSTDTTPDICRELGAKVHHFPWPDSFSIARNESLKHARGEWIFWMDSDDVIDPENGHKLRQLVSQLTSDGATSQARASLSNDPKQGESEVIPKLQPAEKEPPPQNLLGCVARVHCPSTGKDGLRELTVVDHVKLFRNRPDLRFEGRIHEQIIPAIRQAGGEIAWTDLFVVHAGADHSPAGKARKIERDLRLLELDLQERPDHPFVYFNLGMTYGEAERWEEAILALKRSLTLSDPGESQVRKTYALLAANLMKLGRHSDALETCAEGLRLFPREAELLFRQGMLHHEAGLLAKAERSYLAVLAGGGPRQFTSVDTGILGFKTHHNLAIVYADMGALEKAETEWRRSVADTPEYRDGWRGLGETLMRLGKFDELRCLADDLIAQPGLRGLGLAWQAQPPRLARDYAEAGRLLQAAVDELPDDTDVVQACCQLLFEAGDLAECERATTHLLRLTPDNPGAQHNLGTLYLRLGRFADASESLRKSIELAPKNAAVHVHLGHALANLGQCSEATCAFAEALELEPGNRQALEGLERLASLGETVTAHRSPNALPAMALGV
ncbi:MAG TPA: glycosyltransferase [Pirellulales bacterium]|nr:glycosyltransferase [Pirellulales bacterium]